MMGVKTLFKTLKPEFFDNLVSATKIISGYEPSSRTFSAASLAAHMGTTLKQKLTTLPNVIDAPRALNHLTDQHVCKDQIKKKTPYKYSAIDYSKFLRDGTGYTSEVLLFFDKLILYINGSTKEASNGKKMRC
ncbi:hypothetical protein RN001_010193 [Aquatica leii]|uniref:Uncharacterized protein n=1 Tax=Aquatica leii TaxID=1421715 RepID=A0AAN7PW47_9COLE|nr:hypothetical protein RN001_010193 [Aquatica leii]